jgi:hypothetical protein
LAQANLAPDALTPLREWSLRQVQRLHAVSCRERWRHRTWREALAGIKPSPEPDWGLGDPRDPRAVGGVDSAPFTAEDEERYAKMKAEIEGRLSAADPRKPVFPSAM